MGDLIGNKTAYKTLKISKSSPQINLEIIESEAKHKNISPEKN